MFGTKKEKAPESIYPEMNPNESASGVAGTDYSGYEHGLTKREYIAIEAMKSLLSDKHIDAEYDHAVITKAIQYTDYLIEELNKPVYEKTR